MQRTLCLVLMMCIPCAAVAQPDEEALARWLHGELRVATGIDYSRGDYGQDAETEMLYVPLTLTYLLDQFAPSPTARDQLELKLSVPYLLVDGPLEAGAETSARESGIGDVLLGVSYLYYPERAGLPAGELGLRVKLPTADEERGLGTGRTDYTLQLTLFQRYGDFVPFVSAGYRFIGKNRPEFVLRNGATASAGLSWIPMERWSLGISYDWRQAISRRIVPSSIASDALVRSDDGHELTFFGSAPLGAWLRLSPYVVAGLSLGSPEFAVGAQLQVVVPVRPWDGAR